MPYTEGARAARAVGADERDHLAAANIEVDRRQRAHRAVGDRGAAQLHERRAVNGADHGHDVVLGRRRSGLHASSACSEFALDAWLAADSTVILRPARHQYHFLLEELDRDPSSSEPLVSREHEEESEQVSVSRETWKLATRAETKRTP